LTRTNKEPKIFRTWAIFAKTVSMTINKLTPLLFGDFIGGKNKHDNFIFDFG
jgi:hypothetical protein